MGLLEGKVVLITGAGNGLGRAHALACAREGARVVVNDLGGSRDGSGADAGLAAAVVAEIRALGGEAVANTDSVTDKAGCARMVAAAVDSWGRLDAVVNNAGILRDGTFRKMDDAAWALVLDIHLNGTYNVTKAAIDALAASGAGAIVNTTSYSGMIGNFGQSNYAAAKAGIYGFTRVLALELRRANITANCIAPIAKTRMTEELAMVDAEWTAERVSPMVVFLCSALARDVTGKVFGVQGQRIHLYEVKINDGVEKPGAEPWTATEIAAKMDAICAFESGAPAAPAAPVAPSKASPIDEAFARAPGAFMPEKAGDFQATIHFAIVDASGKTLRVEGGRAWVEEGLTGIPTCTVKTDTETIVGILNSTVDAQKAFMKGKITADNMGVLMKFAMYFRFDRATPTPPALAPAPTVTREKTWPIGRIYDGGYAFVEPVYSEAYAEATNDPHVAYYGPGAIAPPMFHTRLFKELLFAVALDPELELDMLRLVHGEHDVTFHHALRPWDLVQLRARLESVEEKSSGRVVVSRMFGIVDGRVAVEAVTTFFIRTAKKAESAEPRAEKAAPRPEPPPEPPPSFTRRFQVAPDQSYRYAKVSLDVNPIHVDPATARAAGLPDVILHGLCTMAMAGKSVVDVLAVGDPRFLKRLSVRFARPVLNGQTLTTLGWKTKEGARFIVKDQDGNVVIANGVAEMRQVPA